MTMNKIALIGDLILDRFIYSKIDRMNPEGPYPLVSRIDEKVSYGGAGNVLSNLKSLGIKVDFFTAESELITEKTRIIVDNKIIFRMDKDRISDNKHLLFEISYKDWSNYDYVVLSDYNKGSLRKVDRIIPLIKSRVIVDPKQPLNLYAGAWCIKPNQKEFGDPTDDNLLQFAKNNRNQLVIVTLGKDGVVYCYQNRVYRIPAISNEVSDVTGAGDCFLAAFVFGLTKGMSIHSAIELGNLGAGVSVKHLGTYTLTKSDLIKKKVFTNGCFDVLHTGHFELLQKSKSLGDYLIVGINSDESVKRLKGNDRPIHTQEERKKALQMIRCVDEVVIFDEDTPYDLIKKIKPDIITKGGDYEPSTVVGNDLAGVVIIPFVEGCSTSKILEKLK